ncbi:MAG: putative hydrolase of the superfamily [Solirubrobacterales bacterium]|jgi:epoxide hydrolase-like predicted phosphatase|nr:putative hydrolase of the superfamily [Solirubrobacterales bacterium]MDX6652964.1 putative hydrolase of the superfamily [Solirubrobacterales bacterium]
MDTAPTPSQPSHSALLIDFGGVLTTDIWQSFDAFCRAEGLPEGTIKQMFRDRPEALAELRKLEKGEADEAAFEASFAELLGVSADGLIERLFEGMEPADRMLEAVRRVRTAGRLTCLVSNSWSLAHYDEAQLRELFDAIVISGQVGLHKPQPEIYELAAERLGLAPPACVFVDDLRENCAGAEAVGMAAILHRDVDETLARLEDLLGVELGARRS